MEFEKPERLFLNECFMCQSSAKISRCTGCNLIAYCGKNCQSKHWSKHKTFCQAISQILQKKRITHIYENISDESLPSWISKRNKIIEEVARKLSRLPNSTELSILKFPRVCFVCKEAKQEKLTNCPNCTVVSFCDLHPKSELHDKNCQIMRNQCDIIFSKATFKTTNMLTSFRTLCAETKILKTDDDPPTSLKQFLDHYTKPGCEITESEQIFFSQCFSYSMTVFQSLKIIYHDNFPSEVFIYIINEKLMTEFYEYRWESLLHLLPNVKCLKIVYKGKTNINQIMSLCKNCTSNKRKLLVKETTVPEQANLSKRNYKKPSLIIFFNMSFPESDDLIDQQYLLKIVQELGGLKCPLVYTFSTERDLTMTGKKLLDSSMTLEILYQGINNFATLMFQQELEDGTFIRQSQFILVFQQRNNFHTSESVAKVNQPQTCFYPQICQVCQKPDAKITCNRCRIISYCGKEHREQHQIHHKDICRVILSLLTETGTTNLFQNAKTSDPDLWLQRKIDMLKKAQTKLDRKLEECERQMFLFPKACAICHDSDSSLLKSCECGAFLCKLHYKDTNHKKLCKELSTAFKFATHDLEPILTCVSNPATGLLEITPSSMLEFINSHFEPSPSYLNHLERNNQLLATSNSVTFPLTLGYFSKKLDFLNKPAVVIHIIDAILDLVTQYLWIIFLFSSQRLKNVKVVFIGPGLINFSGINLNNCDQLPGVRMLMMAEYHAMKYAEYFKSKKFIKPDVIFGINLNIHEAELLGVSENDNCRRETVLTLEKVGVPFILTSGTKERAEKEHKAVCEILGKSANFHFIKENPFASLCPQRDFETEGVMYANKFVIAYDEKFLISPNSTKKKEKIKVNDDNSQKETKSKDPEENKKRQEPISEVKEIDNETEAEKIEIDSKNSDENEIEESDSLLQRIKFLTEENEGLNKQLDSANAQIDKQKNVILNLQKIYTDFFDKNPISDLEKVYTIFVDNLEKSINYE